MQEAAWRRGERAVQVTGSGDGLAGFIVNVDKGRQAGFHRDFLERYRYRRRSAVQPVRRVRGELELGHVGVDADQLLEGDVDGGKQHDDDRNDTKERNKPPHSIYRSTVACSCSTAASDACVLLGAVYNGANF